MVEAALLSGELAGALITVAADVAEEADEADDKAGGVSSLERVVVWQATSVASAPSNSPRRTDTITRRT